MIRSTVAAAVVLAALHVTTTVDAFNVRHRRQNPSAQSSSLYYDTSAIPDSDINLNRYGLVRRTIYLPCIDESPSKPSSSSSSSTSTNQEVTQSILSAFEDVVDHYSNFLVSENEEKENGIGREYLHARRHHNSIDNTLKSGETRSCAIPAFGDDARLVLTTTLHQNGNEDRRQNQGEDHRHGGFTMHMDGIKTDEDFEFLCNTLWDVRLNVDSWMDCPLDITPFRTVVADAMNKRQVAPTGNDASTAEFAGSPHVAEIFEKHNVHALDELFTRGYTVIDTPWTTSESSHDKLSKYLTEKTNQSDHIRRDKVHFLSSDRADTCGVLDQYRLLMGIAHYLNTHYDETTSGDDDDNEDSRRSEMTYTDSISSSHRRSFRTSPHQPLLPGTHDRPLTVPDVIQLAEYGHGDFYVVHSDNSFPSSYTPASSWQKTPDRQNHRHLTCILYMNDDWDEHEDGGALRIYPGSRNCKKPQQVLDGWDYVDISPQNGRMILFDSCLIHSVRAVTAEEKVRRALTVWIYRPEDSHVPGELFY